jgi:hypothetical protein
MKTGLGHAEALEKAHVCTAAKFHARKQTAGVPGCVPELESPHSKTSFLIFELGSAWRLMAIF